MFDRVWDAGYTFDEIQWPDDMGYRNGLLFSKPMWADMVRPYQQRTIDWAHAKGIKPQIHSCGNIMELVPELVDLGHRRGRDPHQATRADGRQRLRVQFRPQHP